MDKSLYLASTSPRRRDLLSRLGVSFQTVAPVYEETPTSCPPREECLIFAEEKAKSVRAQCPKAWILGADTLIEFGGKALGKPKDDEDAVAILQSLMGKTHEVHTAVVLLNSETGETLRHVETARVTFKRASEEEIRAYVATGEPRGKAGAYAVQGRARSLFIENVEGDEEAVIGLPVAFIKKWLREIGLIEASEAAPRYS
ncbi:MAG TPA: Maf family protein [bacterium]|nr:Maf family protein [bacterium]